MADSKDKHIVVGKISGVYGVRGWVRVYSHTEPRENILSYKTWYLEQRGKWVPFQLKNGRQHGKGIVALLAGIDDRTTAETIIQRKIAIEPSQLSQLEDGEFYWRDLIGLKVKNSDDTDLGVIIDLMETGSNDVLVVSDGNNELLIPYIPEQVIVAVDLEDKLVKVDWDPEF